MRHRMGAAITAAVMLVALLGGPARQALPAQAAGEGRYFPETGHWVRGKFLAYWQGNGALERQGFPITEEFQEKSSLNGQVYTVQYFERAVFEYHPENKPPYDVLLSQLGNFWLQAYSEDDPARAPQPPQGGPDGATYFPETKHWVPGLFLEYWNRNGGVAQFGYPLSEAVDEKSKTDGKTYTMQYFERAVFEYHPENEGTPYTVLLRLLGRDELGYRYPDGSNSAEARRPVPQQEQPAPPANGMLADNGFRAAKDGFSFENWGSNYPQEEGSLSLDGFRKMMGDKAVCARFDGGQCVPSKLAATWLDKINTEINGGHCYGMAAASLRLYHGDDNFGAPTTQLQRNRQVDDFISMNWALMMFSPVADEYGSLSDDLSGQTLQKLITMLKNGDMPVLSFWDQRPGMEANAHAVTPWGVEDKGNGQYLIHIYDNNSVGVDRTIQVNANTNTWQYDFGAVNPSAPPDVWTGQKGLGMTRLATQLKQPQCPWCGGSTQSAAQGVAHNTFGSHSSTGGLWGVTASAFGALWNLNAKPLAAASSNYQYIWPSGGERVLVKDSAGRRSGVGADGKLVNEIPGAGVRPWFGGIEGVASTPLIVVPAGVTYDLEVNGVKRSWESIDLLGTGFAATVDDIYTGAGEQNSISLDATGTKVNYTGNSSESPIFRFVVDGAAEDYMVEVEGLDATSGEGLQVGVDQATGRLSVYDAGGGADSYQLTIWNDSATGEDVFYSDELSVDGGDTEYIDVDDWDAGESITVEVDAGSDGDIDSTEVEADEPLPPDEVGIGEQPEQPLPPR